MGTSSKTLKIRLASVEDGLDNTGFRKFSAYVKSIHSNTDIIYLPTGNRLSLIRILLDKSCGDYSSKDTYKIAQYLSKADLIGFSSMTPYASIVHEIIVYIRQLNPKAYIVWGGTHAIIFPEDAIKHADAVCTGEGEFAFEKFLELFKKEKDYTTAPSFWFRKDNNIIKNTNLPLMKSDTMNELPHLTYQDGELIYNKSKGIESIDSSDFIKFSGITYHTIWSIGCPLACTFCANTKFIEYDNNYRRLRYSSPQKMIDEVKRVKSKTPFISDIVFNDDSFLALRYEVLKEFCELWKKEVKIPFAVYGIIPNYVREDKIALLVDAGMNRIRMGIQSGSDNILEFYKRPTKLKRITEATKIFNKFKKYMVPPVYDMILDNPVETAEDTRASLDLIYNLPRPFTLNVFSLRVIPNTTLEKDMKEKGINIPKIEKDYLVGHHKTLGNILVFVLTVWKIPEWLYKILRNKVHPIQTKQPVYPILFAFFRIVYYVKRALGNIRFMNFSVLPGKIAFLSWKIGIISFWHRFILKKYSLPK